MTPQRAHQITVGVFAYSRRKINSTPNGLTVFILPIFAHTMRCFRGTLRTLHKWMRERGTRPRTSGEIGEPKMKTWTESEAAKFKDYSKKRSPKDRGAKKETRDALKELGVEQSPNTWNAHAKKNPVAVKSVKVEAADIWNGDLPTADDTYNRRRAAVTAVAYPLIDFAEYGKRKDGRVVVSFPVEIVMPPDFTEAEVKSAVANLACI